jgi:bifunctional NMN adenylyltransferase/nudix hydrolase
MVVLPPSSLGVVVGRFQVAKLHPGHHQVIAAAISEHERLLIVLGSSRGMPSDKDPLSFAARAQMIAQEYPNAIILEQFDHPSDYIWSRQLDHLIAGVARNSIVTLYGGRDSFIPYYSGCYPIVTVPNYKDYTGTKYRAIIRDRIGKSTAWRQGVIHAVQNRIPQTYSTVDIAVIRPDQVLLAEKYQDEGKLRFFGGFVDNTDSSDEAAAKRELQEEAGNFEIADWHYLGSTRIADWRYKKTQDSIMTRFFVTRYIFGRPEPGDDIDKLHWVSLDTFKENLIPSHIPLGEMLLQFIQTQPNHCF